MRTDLFRRLGIAAPAEKIYRAFNATFLPTTDTHALACPPEDRAGNPDVPPASSPALQVRALWQEATENCTWR